MTAVDAFHQHRRMLIGTAYRLLSSMSDAEDVVQDAWLRWSAVTHDAIERPAAFLRRTVVRLCLDRLKSAQARRESYVGTWLPEPVVEEGEVEDVTLPLLLALERLSPLERAAFLLHDVFGESFEDIAATLDRDVAACRQLASRARRNVRQDRPRYRLERSRALEIAAAFFAASRRDDLPGLQRLLADDVRMHADGGGKRPAVPHVLNGSHEVARVLTGFARVLERHGGSKLVRYAFINGLPGFVTVEPDGVQTTALLIGEDGIKAIYVMRNPDKLGRVEQSLASGGAGLVGQ